MITLSQAQKATELAIAKAEELGAKITVTIVDRAGIVIAVAKMDGSIDISPKFSYVKAYTSASIGAPTGGLKEYAEEGKPYYGLNSILGGQITTIAGGQPIMLNSTLAGGVGVGGSMDVAQDDECAKAALAAFA